MATLLHTSDWHVGATIRGRSRADEHRAVLAEIAEVTEERSVDVVVVAGDLFETAAPSPESEEIVYQALMAFTRAGARVAVIAGNHDNAGRLRAVTPLLELGGVHLVSSPRGPADGGVRTVPCRSGGEIDVAMLPFVSQRGIVRAADLMGSDAFQHAQFYAARLSVLISLLSSSFVPDRPGVLVAHGFVGGGITGGGERAAHLVEEYQIPSTAFGATTSYVALGHLHRAQKLAGATAIHYCGSPLQLDFGEQAQIKQVNLVELEPDRPAVVRPVELASGCPLVTVAGTVDELRAAVGTVDPRAWVRVRVREPRRAGLADEVRELLGERVVDVTIADPDAPPRRPAARRRSGTSPSELFAGFLAERSVVDPRLGRLFDELHDEVVSAASAIPDISDADDPAAGDAAVDEAQPA